MSTEIYSNTTASAILTRMAADRVFIDFGAIEEGHPITVTGTRNLVGGGTRTTTYVVTRLNDVHDSRTFNCTRTYVESK